jgi:hypothetical protein
VTRKFARGRRRRPRRDPVVSYIHALMCQVERYRPIGAGDVPLKTRLADEGMLRYVRDDLRLDQLRLKWFSASDRHLTSEEMEGPAAITLLSLNGGCVRTQYGRVSEDEPTVVWCRSDLAPHMAAKVVAHEARHAWQITQEQAGALPRPLDGGEKDAHAYARRLVPVARGLVSQGLRENGDAHGSTSGPASAESRSAWPARASTSNSRTTMCATR